MNKIEIIMRKAQKGSSGENIILCQEVTNTFTSKGHLGNLGFLYAYAQKEFYDSYGELFGGDIWESIEEIDDEAKKRLHPCNIIYRTCIFRRL